MSKKLLEPLLCFSLLGYFVYHTIQGDRGIVSWMRLQHKLRDAQDQLAALQNIHDQISNRVDCLRPEKLDLDLLSERVIQVLGYAPNNGLVLCFDNS